jgi:hypothetical protein
MGLLPDLNMDNAAGLRLSIDSSEAYDQISISYVSVVTYILEILF